MSLIYGITRIFQKLFRRRLKKRWNIDVDSTLNRHRTPKFWCFFRRPSRRRRNIPLGRHYNRIVLEKCPLGTREHDTIDGLMYILLKIYSVSISFFNLVVSKHKQSIQCSTLYLSWFSNWVYSQPVNNARNWQRDVCHLVVPQVKQRFVITVDGF